MWYIAYIWYYGNICGELFVDNLSHYNNIIIYRHSLTTTDELYNNNNFKYDIDNNNVINRNTYYNTIYIISPTRLDNPIDHIINF